MNIEYLNKVLLAGVKNNASDIHLKVGRAPLYRVNGALREIKAPQLTPEDTDTIVATLLQSSRKEVDIASLTEYDASYYLEGAGRFRVNIFRQRGSLALILRVIPLDIPSFEQLGLPPVLNKIAEIPRGLVLVTGVTGSGKSSTLAALIDHINTNRQEHIITLEDPIEFIHPEKKSSVSQREIGSDTPDFTVALRASLRQDPDVILIGEMRDYETIDIALKAAETGHLVLSTVHTTDAVKTIGRLVGVFPAEQQEGARLRLADNLRSSISQRLVPRKDGKGRVVACEIMISNTSVQECIKNPEKTGGIKDAIERGSDISGTQTFDMHLASLYNADLISLDAAKAASTNPTDFERALNFE
jgi:twitching motility protein PilT